MNQTEEAMTDPIKYHRCTADDPRPPSYEGPVLHRVKTTLLEEGTRRVRTQCLYCDHQSEFDYPLDWDLDLALNAKHDD